MQEEKEKREIPTPAILLTMLGQLKRQGFRKRSRFTVRRERREHCQIAGLSFGRSQV